MFLKLPDIRIEPDRLAEIKGVTDLVQSPEHLVRSRVRGIIADHGIRGHPVVFPYLSPQSKHLKSPFSV